ncbi:MAG TPA: XRE family transcriptional regulator [Terriglobales bacterium]|nr:XRE family transcriptional regulator [Terriglobales bacterium]
MSGRKSFATLRAQMSPGARARAEAAGRRLRSAMDLAELRRARRLSQQELADTLRVGQATVAKIEKRTDIYVSTLRRMVEGLGGTLEIVARFDGRAVRIRQFSDLGATAPATARPR